MAKLLEAGKLTSLTGKTWKIKVIEGDRQGSSTYYPKEVLESGKHLFKEGTRIFRNHPSSDAKWNQPERRIEDIIGYLSEDATFDGKDLYANATFLESEQGRIKELAEAGLIAMSIRAEGELTEGSNGMELARFTAVHSVDVVTTAGAGGAFEKLLESANEENNSQANALEEAQEEETELELPKEFTDALDQLVEAAKANTEAIASLVERQDAADKAAAEALEEANKPKELSFSQVTEALVEAGLSTKARARVLAAVEGGADLTESIKAEKEIAAEILAEAAKGSGAGHIEESTAPKKFDFGSVYGD